MCSIIFMRNHIIYLKEYNMGSIGNRNSSVLTEEEKTALRQYTGSYYGRMNSDLRGGYELAGKAKNRAELLDKAIEKQNLSSPITVYRGVSGEIFGVARNINENDIKEFVGKVIPEPAYMSTSFSKDGAYHDDILLEINVPAGHGIGIDVMSNLPPKIQGSAKEREKEYLIARGFGLKINSFKRVKDGRFEVDATLVEKRKR